jgi:cysteine-rich repeat protein
MTRMRTVLVGLWGVFSSAVACRQVAGIEAGIPIECMIDQDCAGMTDVCRIGACEQGVCVLEEVAEGTATAEQTPGNCLQAVCDGAGKVKMVFLADVVCKTGLLGICAEGLQRCNEQGQPEGDCFAPEPKVEQCDAAGLDEDCDGLVNEEGANCVCGDGYVSKGEACDDGGTVGGDKCSALCQEETVLQVVAGGAHTCARLNGGSIKCWGDNDFGQLGLSDMAARGDGPGEMGEALPPVNLGSGKTATVLAAGTEHTCARLNDGSVKCWGRNEYGQLGLGDTAARGDGPGEMGDVLPPVNLGTDKTATALAAGREHTCALLDDGSIKCWGRNDFGQLGLGDTAARGDGPGEMGDALPAVNLGTGKTVTALVAGGEHTCARFNDGSVKCWGDNDFGQLGLGDTGYRGDGPGEMGDALPAVNLGTGKTATALAAGGFHTCARLNDDSVKCWGYNFYGQLGLGDTANRGDNAGELGDALPAVNLGTGKTATAPAAGSNHTCARFNDGSVKCWGLNRDGQLGLSDNAHRGDTPDEMGDTLPTVKLYSATW